jgi:hypothetical protein
MLITPSNFHHKYLNVLLHNGGKNIEWGFFSECLRRWSCIITFFLSFGLYPSWGNHNQSYCSKTLIRAQNIPAILTVKFIYYLAQIKVLVTDINKPENSVLSVHRSRIARSMGSNRIDVPPPPTSMWRRISILRNVVIETLKETWDG